MQSDYRQFAGTDDTAAGGQLSYPLPVDELPASMPHLTGEALDERRQLPLSHNSEVPATPTPPPASTAALQQQAPDPADILAVGKFHESGDKLPEKAADSLPQSLPQLLGELQDQSTSNVQCESKVQQRPGGSLHGKLQEARSLAARPAGEGADDVFGSITMHQQRLGSINFTARTAGGGADVRNPAAEASDRPQPSAVPSTSPLKVLKMAGTRQVSKPSETAERISRTFDREEAMSKQIEGAQASSVPLQTRRTDGIIKSEPSNAALPIPDTQLPKEDNEQDVPSLKQSAGMFASVLGERVEDSEPEDEAGMIEASQPAIFTQ